ncbi:MAG TPA: hypothetical protein D7I13_01100 [Candidatus Poseidoniales archaeon]|nr:MAG TPA: hypothetical protein D7I13_01100 [Candidatus Poseidoniales archaeon]|tara:strand:+ start:438 stop:1121 length:684 start_codon:yes stop_codon:yes gene_type:complete
MLMRLISGNVRYRFRSDDFDVNIVIEGEANWVQKHVEELGLTGVGWTMPIGTEVKATNLSSVSQKRKEAGINIEMADETMDERPLDMGPTPDPSRIPTVRRPIGELNLQEKLNQAGLEPAGRPDAIELMEILDDMDPPTPVQGATSVDPMAEAWLRELLQLVVRDHGASGLSTEDIEEIASKKLGNREGTALEVWLESLFSAGKLVKIHGGDAVGWGPSPKWLAGRF